MSKTSNSIKQIILKPARLALRALRNKRNDLREKKEAERLRNILTQDRNKTIFYLGITQHQNLGDLAQFYCISKWLEEYCGNEYDIQKFDADSVVNRRYGFLDTLAHHLRKDDVILFQSGYCTQDLGGVHNLMHEMVAEKMPDANILMMPQTILFKDEKNKRRTSEVCNKCSNMLFLARDFNSFETAKEMFPDVEVIAYPDIVTSLIGKYKFNNKRERAYICYRNDGEKYYSDAELLKLKTEIEKTLPVDTGDTQSKAQLNTILGNLKKHIENEIEKYSHYKVTITDRYHGTIFSIIAGTPVVIIKTNDHKVTTGADWFKGIFDNHVYVAKDLQDAYDIANKIIESNEEFVPTGYFEEKYYGEALLKLFKRKFTDHNN